MSKIRVVLADDHPIVRQGLRTLIEQSSDLSIVGEAETGEQALAVIQQTQPDVVVLDIEMPQLSGLEVVQQLQGQQPPVRVLILSGHADPVYVRNVVNSGVAGYLTKEEAPDRLIEAIHGVARGESGWFSQRVTTQLSQWVRLQSGNQALGDREREVLHLVAQGWTNQQIGRRLQISTKTVEKHVGVLMGKLSLASRVALAVWAVHHGEVDACALGLEK